MSFPVNNINHLPEKKKVTSGFFLNFLGDLLVLLVLTQKKIPHYSSMVGRLPFAANDARKTTKYRF